MLPFTRLYGSLVDQSRLANYCVAFLLIISSIGCRPGRPSTSGSGSATNLQNIPVTLRYVGEATPSAPINPADLPELDIFSGRVFWVTNHTTNIVAVSVVVETKQPSGWILLTNHQTARYSLRFQTVQRINIPAENRPPEKSSTNLFRLDFAPDVKNTETVAYRRKELFVLAPGQAAYATAQSSDQWNIPRGTQWRVKTVVNVQARGFQELASAAKNYPGILKTRLKTGDTHFPLDPKKITWLGPPIELAGPTINEP